MNRFMMKQIGMGLLYFFTAGFCLIGTIVDILNYKSLTSAYNQKRALEVANLIYGAFPQKIEESTDDE